MIDPRSLLHLRVLIEPGTYRDASGFPADPGDAVASAGVVGYHLDQSTDALRPHRANGSFGDCLLFDGGDSLKRDDLARSFESSAAGTVVLLYRWTGSGNGFPLCLASDTDHYLRLRTDYYALSLSAKAGGSGALLSGKIGNGPRTDAPNLVSAGWGDGSGWLRRDGGRVTERSVTADGAIDPAFATEGVPLDFFTLGGSRFAIGDAITTPFKGEVYAFAAFSRKLSDADVRGVEEWFRARLDEPGACRICEDGAVFVSTVDVDPAHEGLFPDEPLPSLAAAFARAPESVRIDAPADAPLRENAVWPHVSTATIRPSGSVRPRLYGSGRIVRGWDYEGEGVYSTTVATVAPPSVVGEALALWLPLASALFADEAGTTPCFVGQTAKRMADQSGHGHHLTSEVGLERQPDGTLRSTGEGAVGAGWLGCDDAAVTTALQGSHTGYFVGQIDVPGEGVRALASAGKLSGAAQIVLRGDLATPRVTRTNLSGNQGAAAETTIAAVVGKVRLYAWSYDATTATLTLYRDGEFMASSVLTSGSGSCPVDNFTVMGLRQGGAFVGGVVGRFAGGAIYEGAHTDEQVREVSAYLASFTSAPVAAAGTIYVDAKEGRDTNGGRFPSEPFESMDMARKRRVSRMRVKFARDPLLWNTNPGFEGPVTIEPYPGQESFLWDVGVRTKGWKRVGATNVWRIDYPATANDPAPSRLFAVSAKIPTPVLGDGRTALKAVPEDGAQGSPILNQFGYFQRDNGSGYVSIHLGTVDPNGVDVVLGRHSSCLVAVGPERVTVRRAIGRFAGESNFSAGFTAIYPGGNLFCEDCQSWWGGRDGGFATRGEYVSAEFVRCKARFSANDGFNIHAAADNLLGVVRMTDCEAFGDGDEAVSAHDTNLVTIVRGQFGHCGSGCLTNIQNTTCYVDGARFYEGNRTNPVRTAGGVSGLDSALIHLKNSLIEDCRGPFTYQQAPNAAVVNDGGNIYRNTVEV